MLDYNKIMPIAKAVANQVTSKFPSYILAEDTLGSLLLFIYEKRSYIESAVEDGPGWEAKIASTFRKVAFDHCNNEKAAIEGYDMNDAFNYQTTAVKELFIQYVEDTLTPEHREEVRSALTKIDAEALRMLTYRLRHGLSFQGIGTMLGISEAAAAKRFQRAVRLLQKALGYKDPKEPREGRRRAVRSNAAWRAQIGELY